MAVGFSLSAVEPLSHIDWFRSSVSKQRSRVWAPEHLCQLNIHGYLNSSQWRVLCTPDGIFRPGEAIHSSEHHHITGVRCYQTGQNHQTCLLLTEQAEAEFRSRSAWMTNPFDP